MRDNYQFLMQVEPLKEILKPLAKCQDLNEKKKSWQIYEENSIAIITKMSPHSLLPPVPNPICSSSRLSKSLLSLWMRACVFRVWTMMIAIVEIY